MNEKIKIIAGVAIFAVIFTCPLWINMGKAKEAPVPVLSDKAKAAKASRVSSKPHARREAAAGTAEETGLATDGMAG